MPEIDTMTLLYFIELPATKLTVALQCLQNNYLVTNHIIMIDSGQRYSLLIK